jgi:hypothetical protein
MSRGAIVLLGSGEIAPGMVKVHRDLLAELGDVRAVNLDTSYGFQENVPQMTEKIVDYFSTSLRVAIETVHFPRYDAASQVERALVRQRVREATYVFAGPGSPSYALAQWRPLGLRDDLEAVLVQGGTVVFASAAALTLGSHTAPIYEVYKAGADPYWLPGLDLMAVAGLSCAVIPHFDNAEGASHDTRFCYLGERRLALLEDELPADTAVLGIDEHTALIIDLEIQSLTVRGRSHAYWRLDGETFLLENGSTVTLASLPTASPTRVTVASPPETTGPSSDSATPLELAAVALAAGPDAADALARLVALASRTPSGPALSAEPLVLAALEARNAARLGGDYALADRLRDLLTEAGVVLADGPTGTTWSFAD